MINVTAVNDAPSFTKGADQTVLEDSGINTIPGWATAISKGGADESGQTLTFVVTNNTNPALFAAGPRWTAERQADLHPAANAYGTATITLRAGRRRRHARTAARISRRRRPSTSRVTNVNDAPRFTKWRRPDRPRGRRRVDVAGWVTAISAGPNEGVADGQLRRDHRQQRTPALFRLPGVSPIGHAGVPPARQRQRRCRRSRCGSRTTAAPPMAASISRRRRASRSTSTPVNDVPVIGAGGTLDYTEATGAVVLAPAVLSPTSTRRVSRA